MARRTSQISYEVLGAPSSRDQPAVRGRVYAVGQSVATSFSCSDATDAPGIQSCTDSGGSSDGTGVLDTSKAGSFTYTVTATSQDGQVAYNVDQLRGGGRTVGDDRAAVRRSDLRRRSIGADQLLVRRGDRRSRGQVVHRLRRRERRVGSLDTSKPGSFTYTVTATSSDGQTGQASVGYTVAAAPSAAISQPADGQTSSWGSRSRRPSTATRGRAGRASVLRGLERVKRRVGVVGHLEGGRLLLHRDRDLDRRSEHSALDHLQGRGSAVGGDQPAGERRQLRPRRTVQTHFTCSPGVQESGIQSCRDSTGSSTGTGTLNTSKLGSFSYAVTGVGTDGQTTTKSVSYTVANAPTVTISQPAAGQTYQLGQSVPTAFSCAEGAGAPGLPRAPTRMAPAADPGRSTRRRPGRCTPRSTATSQDGLSTSKTLRYAVKGVPTKAQIACSPAIKLIGQTTNCTITVTTPQTARTGRRRAGDAHREPEQRTERRLVHVERERRQLKLSGERHAERPGHPDSVGELPAGDTFAASAAQTRSSPAIQRRRGQLQQTKLTSAKRQRAPRRRRAAGADRGWPPTPGRAGGGHAKSGPSRGLHPASLASAAWWCSPRTVWSSRRRSTGRRTARRCCSCTASRRRRRPGGP